MKIKLIIFDLDGTLVDAYQAIYDSFNFTMRKIGFPLQRDAAIKKAVGWGDHALLRPFIGEGPLEEALRIYRKHHKQSLMRKSRMLKGAKRTLLYLRKKGYKLAIASNRPAEFSRILMKHLRIYNLFDMVLCGDELKNHKPHPQILLEILKKLSVKKKQAIYIGDMTVDVQTGKRAGVKAIAVLTGSSTKAELKKLKPYLILKDVSFLSTVL